MSDVPADVEWERLAPVLAPLRAAVPVPLSLDTTSASVLARALEIGVDLLNDVSALGDDPELAGVAARAGLPVILMHRRGTPRTMQVAPSYADAPAEVRAELLVAVARAEAAGIPRERLLLDPGIGFGKRLEDNPQHEPNPDEDRQQHEPRPRNQPVPIQQSFGRRSPRTWRCPG